MAVNFTVAEKSTCSGMVETFEELRAELSELHDNCTVNSMNSPLPCKILICIHLLAENRILVYINGLHTFVEGVCWTQFWWYTPCCGWLAYWGNRCPWRFVMINALTRSVIPAVIFFKLGSGMNDGLM